MQENNHRREDRKSLSGSVMFRKPTELPYEVTLQDLSPQGCRIALRERVLPGQLVWITLPGLENLPSLVRWSGEWTAGIEFEKPMHAAVFDHVAARLCHAG